MFSRFFAEQVTLPKCGSLNDCVRRVILGKEGRTNVTYGRNLLSQGPF